MIDECVGKSLKNVAKVVDDFYKGGLITEQEACYAKTEIGVSLLADVMKIISADDFEAQKFVGSVCTDLNAEIAKKWWN